MEGGSIMDDDIFASIMRGAKEAAEYMQGKNLNVIVHIPKDIDVRSTRQKLKMTQKKFS